MDDHNDIRNKEVKDIKKLIEAEIQSYTILVDRMDEQVFENNFSGYNDAVFAATIKRNCYLQFIKDLNNILENG